MQSLDRNTIIGFVLLGILLILFTVYNQPSKEQLAIAKKKKDSIELVTKENYLRDSLITLQKNNQTFLSKDSIINSDSVTNNQNSKKRIEEFYVLENDLLKATVSNIGARIVSVELKNKKTWDDKPLVLFSNPNTSYGYIMLSGAEEINTKNLSFIVDSTNNSNSLILTTYANDKSISFKYSVSKDSYIINYDVKLNGATNDIQKLIFNWKASLNELEQSSVNEIANSSIYYKFSTEDDVEHITEGSDGEQNIPAGIDWLSFKQQYFNSTILGKNAFESGNIKITPNTKPGVLKNYEADLVMNYKRGENASYNLQFNFSPNDYNLLKKYNNELQHIIPLGWGIFGWFSRPVNKWFIIPMFDFFNNYISNYGIIILIITVLLKILLFPLTYRSLLSAAKMRVLKPEIDELKAKYAEDQTRFGQEQLKLFQKAGVNPLGGCIPMLLQMPILIAMYSYFPVSIELRQQSFLWANDLSTYDSIYNFPNHFSLPFYGSHVSLFTLLMTVSSIVFAIYNNQLTGVTGQMKWMAYIFPVMLLGVFNNLSSGLTYYYFLSNVISFLQQFIVQKVFINEAAIHKQIQENKKKTPKKSGFMQRLENMQRDQKELQQKRKK